MISEDGTPDFYVENHTIPGLGSGNDSELKKDSSAELGTDLEAPPQAPTGRNSGRLCRL